MTRILITGFAVVATLSLSTSAASTPTFWPWGEVWFERCSGGELGPWSFSVAWYGSTGVSGVDAGDVQEISVDVYWEVPLGDQDPAGFGWDSNAKQFSTFVQIDSADHGESHDTAPYEVWADFDHSAALPSLNWYPWAVTPAVDYTDCGAN